MLKKTAFAGVIFLLIIGLCIPCITAVGRTTMISNLSDEPSYEANQTFTVRSQERARFNETSASGMDQLYVLPAVTKRVRIASAAAAAPWETCIPCGIGETVSFMTVGTVPENVGEFRSCFYRFTEELPEGLNYEDGSANITLNDENGLDISKHFEIIHEHGAINVTCRDLRSLGDTSQLKQIVLCYRAVLNSGAVMGNPGNICKSSLEFSVDPLWEGEGNPPTERSADASVAIFTFGMNVSKVDMETQLPVAFVEFILRDEAGKYLVTTNDAMVDRWTSERRDASPLRTDEQGAFSLFGFAPGTYFLEETKTADGYHILDEPVKLQLVALNSETQPGKVDKLSVIVGEGDPVYSSSDNCDMVDIKIENMYGPELPPTGGAGTSVYYILGVVVVFAAALVYVAKRREKSTAES